MDTLMVPLTAWCCELGERMQLSICPCCAGAWWNNMYKDERNFMTKEHHIKAWPDMYEPMTSGQKPFDIRQNDRGYQKGDLVILHEWNPDTKEYTGRMCKRLITYVLSGWGLQPNYVVLGYADDIPEFMRGKA